MLCEFLLYFLEYSTCMYPLPSIEKRFLKDKMVLNSMIAYCNNKYEINVTCSLLFTEPQVKIMEFSFFT